MYNLLINAKIIVIVVIFLSSSVLFAANNNAVNHQNFVAIDENRAAQYSHNEKKEIVAPVNIDCSSYGGCIDYYNSLDANQQKEIVMIYYNHRNSESRYNIYNNIIMRVGSMSCPPLLDIYQKVNNINNILDVFEKRNTSECYSYYSNINGSGMDRTSIVGQLDMVFCKEPTLDQTCNHGVMLIKRNDFIYETE